MKQTVDKLIVKISNPLVVSIFEFILPMYKFRCLFFYCLVEITVDGKKFALTPGVGRVGQEDHIHARF